MSKTAIIIGGGTAGMETASQLARLGVEVDLIEKQPHLGGHLKNWDRLFPNRRNSDEVFDYLEKGMNDGISLHLNAEISNIRKSEEKFTIALQDGKELQSDALVIATGYEVFDARKKEEYGYGIYDNVITSVELEEFFRSNKQKNLLEGVASKRIGIIHCVGSRDEKAGNLYCSKLCCVTGVKQAIEIKELMPDAEIFCFYMDLRMFDRHFEEMYYEAQEKWGIQFIRGRLSEASENTDHTLLVKVEDTLTGLPLKMKVDLLILLVGFVPSPETRRLAAMLGLKEGDDRFLCPADEHTITNSTEIPGVFLAGTVKGPAGIANTITDARATAIQVADYLK
ncbi:MAG: FAD-dependent oxidoreductase [Bacteroidetes bacterium]|nr:FAD-dependent oxidoreductase [Bacteroidota bacterium]